MFWILTFISLVICSDFYLSPNGTGESCSVISPCATMEQIILASEGQKDVNIFIANGEYIGTENTNITFANINSLNLLGEGSVQFNGQQNDYIFYLNNISNISISGINMDYCDKGIIFFNISTTNIHQVQFGGHLPKAFTFNSTQTFDFYSTNLKINFTVSDSEIKSDVVFYLSTNGNEMKCNFGSTGFQNSIIQSLNSYNYKDQTIYFTFDECTFNYSRISTKNTQLRVRNSNLLNSGFYLEDDRERSSFVYLENLYLQSNISYHLEFRYIASVSIENSEMILDTNPAFIFDDMATIKIYNSLLLTPNSISISKTSSVELKNCTITSPTIDIEATSIIVNSMAIQNSFLHWNAFSLISLQNLIFTNVMYYMDGGSSINVISNCSFLSTIPSMNYQQSVHDGNWSISNSIFRDSPSSYWNPRNFYSKL